MGRSRRWNKPCRLGMIRLAGRRLRLGRGVKSSVCGKVLMLFGGGARGHDTPID